MVQLKKTTIIIAVLLIVTSLSIGIIIGLTWNKSSTNQSPTSSSTYSPTPQVTITPMPTNAQTIVNIAYSEIGRTEPTGTTRLVLSVNATLISGTSASFDYSKFSLAVFIPRGGLLPSYIGMVYATVVPLERGSKTVSIAEQTAIFSLTFEFPAVGKNFDDNVVHFSSYQLEYNSNIPTIQWADR
jgi:hypothetical protein